MPLYNARDCEYFAQQSYTKFRELIALAREEIILANRYSSVEKFDVERFDAIMDDDFPPAKVMLAIWDEKMAMEGV